MTYKTSCVCLFFVSSVHFGHKSSELKEKQNCREKARRVALRTVRAHDDHRSPHGKDHYHTARKLPELQDNGGRRGAYRLTEDYAKKIGADYYCKDALSDVRIAEEVYPAR